MALQIALQHGWLFEELPASKVRLHSSTILLNQQNPITTSNLDLTACLVSTQLQMLGFNLHDGNGIAVTSISARIVSLWVRKVGWRKIGLMLRQKMHTRTLICKRGMCQEEFHESPCYEVPTCVLLNLYWQRNGLLDHFHSVKENAFAHSITSF